MQILADKLLALRPDLVVAGKAVSRHAQVRWYAYICIYPLPSTHTHTPHLYIHTHVPLSLPPIKHTHVPYTQEHLRRHRVALIQHANSAVLDRLSRLTGARILPSTDHIHAVGQGAAVIGTCARFRVVTYPRVEGSVGEGKEGGEEAKEEEEGEEEKEDAASIAPRPSLPLDQLPPPVRSPLQQRGEGRTRRPVAYAYVEGCPPALGGAVVLRGGPWGELKVRAGGCRDWMNAFYACKSKSTKRTRGAFPFSHSLSCTHAHISNKQPGGQAPHEAHPPRRLQPPAGARLPPRPLRHPALRIHAAVRLLCRFRPFPISICVHMCAYTCVSPSSSLIYTCAHGDLSLPVLVANHITPPPPPPPNRPPSSSRPILSSSLAVDFGPFPPLPPASANNNNGPLPAAATTEDITLPPPTTNKNGDSSSDGVVPPTFEAQQHLLVTSVWMRERVQCSNAEVHVLYRCRWRGAGVHTCIHVNSAHLHTPQHPPHAKIIMHGRRRRKNIAH